MNYLQEYFDAGKAIELQGAMERNTIPEWMHKSLIRYVMEGIVPSSDFLHALICNDLSRCIGHADNNSIQALQRLVQVVYSYFPCSCWGSKQDVSHWAGLGGFDTIAKNRSNT